MRPGRKAATVPMKAPGRPAKGPTVGPMPEIPWPLEGLALAEWERFAPILHADGRLTPAAAPMLAIYCQAYARKHDAAEDLRLNGPVINTDLGGSKANPAAAVVKEADGTMIKILAAFGGSPADLARLKLVEAAPSDALADFLNRQKARAAL